MRQQVVTQRAAGASAWQFTDNRRFGGEFNASLMVSLNSTANLTYDVDLTYDLNAQERYQIVQISRTTTTATVTLVDHGLATGDSVLIFATNYAQNNPESNLEGTFDITVVDDDTFTYTVANTGQTAAHAKLISFRVVKHPTLQGKIEGEAGVLDSPVSAVRLNVTSFTAGEATLTVLQQG